MQQNFFEILTVVRPELETAIAQAFEQLRNEGVRYPYDDWLLTEAARRSTGGKLMRGGILVAMYEALGGTNRRAAVRAAAALELYGTALLFHDDVMDRSDSRRGLPTMHRIAAAQAAREAFQDTAHFGNSVAMCVGDLLFFMADQLLCQLVELGVEQKMAAAVQHVTARELQLLGLAQIEDLRLAASSPRNDSITEHDITAMIIGKSARYSVCWPLAVAAVLAGSDPATRQHINAVGEQIGLLFQLRDDELGLLGDPAVTGKSDISDLREGKKTLYWLALRQRYAPEDPAWQVFGNQQASDTELYALRDRLVTEGLTASVREKMQSLQRSVLQQLSNDQQSLTPLSASLLRELAHFVLDRQK